jgi:hypothetical protein
MVRFDSGARIPHFSNNGEGSEMRSYRYQIERLPDETECVSFGSGAFQAENSREAWQRVMGEILLDGRWKCTLWNGARELRTRIFIRGAKEITQRAKELVAS